MSNSNTLKDICQGFSELSSNNFSTFLRQATNSLNPLSVGRAPDSAQVSLYNSLYSASSITHTLSKALLPSLLVWESLCNLLLFPNTLCKSSVFVLNHPTSTLYQAVKGLSSPFLALGDTELIFFPPKIAVIFSEKLLLYAAESRHVEHDKPLNNC